MTDWAILIATIGRRQERFLRLLGQLAPQVEAAEGRVRVMALWNNGERPVSQVRQDLVEAADARYISFIDDDDQVPPYYVARVLPLLDGTDYIGWRMQCYLDGIEQKPTFHRLRYDGWSDDAEGYYRDVSHLNPVRAELARQADFRRHEPDGPEDLAWAGQMKALLRTEHFIPEVMYYYHSNGEDSSWRGFQAETGQHHRPEVSYPWFRWHPWAAE